MVLGIFKIAVRLRDQQVFFGQSVEISNILYTSPFFQKAGLQCF